MWFWSFALIVKYTCSFPPEEIYIVNSQRLFSQYYQYLVLSRFSAEMRFYVILYSVFSLLDLTSLSLSLLIVVQTAFSCILAVQWLSVYWVATIKSNNYTNLRNRKVTEFSLNCYFWQNLIKQKSIICNKSTARDI